LIELAGQVNAAMPAHVVSRIVDALNEEKKPLNGSRVHILGVAYKRNVGDLREAPALDVMELVERRGGVLSYTDPFVPRLERDGRTLMSLPFDEAVAAHPDCTVIITDHSAFDPERIVEGFSLIVDTRNTLKNVRSERVFRL
jgi:UDP-N-acetyl-D-glucosamine dehydrogenase